MELGYGLKLAKRLFWSLEVSRMFIEEFRESSEARRGSVEGLFWSSKASLSIFVDEFSRGLGRALDTR